MSGAVRNALRYAAATGAGFGGGYLYHRYRSAAETGPPGAPKVAVIPMAGVIEAASSEFSSSGISYDRLEGVIRRTMRNPEVAAVVFRINSPGGSPVQSSRIHELIRAEQARRSEEDAPIATIAYAEDVCASGGYYIACACDTIACDPSSIVGSIGVISSDFGFAELIKRIGVERRVQTSGRLKSMGDPFKETSRLERSKKAGLLDDIHSWFAYKVISSRGDRLDFDAARQKTRRLLEAAGEADEEGYQGMGLTDGSVYAGMEALDVGLVDVVEPLDTLIHREYPDAFVQKVKVRASFFNDFIGAAFGAEALLRLVEQRLAFGAYGLLPPRC